MELTIPKHILTIYQRLQNAGFSVYFVGGCVRNLLMKKPVNDWDLTTNATPQELLAVFPTGFYDNTFGTVGIPITLPVISNEVRDLKNDHNNEEDFSTASNAARNDTQKTVVEITTFRTEHGYTDRRRPDTVTWGSTIEEDLERRDFTINAIALRISSFEQGKPTEKVIIDPYDGQIDIANKLIRAVGDPEKRFSEDALRLMRAVRIATQLSFRIEDQTWKALQKNASLIKDIAMERIHSELMKILASSNPYEGIVLLKDSGLMAYILPELLEGVDVSQVRPGRHHTTNVFTHNILSMKYSTSENPVVRFATLLHDVGKPKVRSTDEEGFVIFHNHEIVGAKIAKDIADRLRFSKKDRDKIVTLIRWHMFTVDEKITDAAVRRFIRRVGVENVKDMMDLRIGDRLGGGTQTAESWRLKLFKKRVEEQLQPTPFSINDLAIDGNDIMKELHMKPGPKVGEILQKLFEEVDEDLSKNTKDYLGKRLHELAST